MPLTGRLGRRRAPSVDPTVFEFLQDILLVRAATTSDERAVHESFALRFQQLTSPVMAKSVEDTAFYRYHRMIALNEVGGDPTHFGMSVEDFHALSSERLRSWPLSMLTTSTHDTKRGEDAGARISVLTEMPALWRRTVTQWARVAEAFKTPVDDTPAPARRDEYLFFQALVGAWPCGWDGRSSRDAFTERMASFMEKATNEAKVETSWIRPNALYDRALRVFVERALNDDVFMEDVRAFCLRLGTYGASNGIAKTLLRLCSPGVPDTYHGAELWNQSLVDPDNRREVDYPLRRALLEQIEAASDRGALLRRLLETWTDGAIKLFVTQVALRTRREQPDVFLRGNYDPLRAGDHAIAFARTRGTQRVVVCVPRLAFKLTRGEHPWAIGDAWGDQTLPLPIGDYREAFTGTTFHSDGLIRIADLLRAFPAALLSSS